LTESEINDQDATAGVPKVTSEFFGGDDLRAKVFLEKYALKDMKGTLQEITPPQMWRRVAREIASAESSNEKRAEWEEKFYWLLENFAFIPGGRILFGAGQSRRATLLNCLRGSTNVLIRRQPSAGVRTSSQGSGLVAQSLSVSSTIDCVPISSIAGEDVEVLTPAGWSRVKFRSFGRQKLFRLSLKNGDTLFATGNHEWVLRTKGALVKTTTRQLMNLSGYRGLALSLPTRPAKDRRYYDGVVHGIVYGTGPDKRRKNGNTYRLQLSGPKRELAKYLPAAREVDLSSKIPRDILFTNEMNSAHDFTRPPPENETSSYWYGFLSGFLAASARVDSRSGGVSLESRQKGDLQAIKMQLGRLGIIGNRITKVKKGTRDKMQLGARYRLRLRKSTLSEDLFLRTDHAAIYRKSPQPQRNYTIGIESITTTAFEEEVYCCEEPKTHTFVLGNGVLTGNCYVLPVKEDSIEGIFDWCKEAARTYSLGGGVGTDISILRPKGAPVHNAAAYSTGAVSFMNVMSETTGTIGQAGRRGALMITIRVDHPDIFDFIKVKRNLKNVRYANISVRVTDEFMRAVESDSEFALWYDGPVTGRIERVVRARELWKELVNSARDWAEPGIIFWDAVKRGSPSEYNGLEVLTTNPCSEQPLQPYGACDLGSINLSHFVKDAFGARPTLDWESLEKCVRVSVRFLDDVLTYNNDRHPLPAQSEACRAGRRIGLGFTGLADMLAKLKIKYDSEDSLEYIDHLFEKIKLWAYDASVELAKEKGPFPLFDATKHLERPFIAALPEELRSKIKENGLRNVCILTVPPVGSGSVLAGTSSGIEPIFAFSYTRRSESLSQEYFKVYHPLVAEYIAKFNLKSEDELPEYFVPAHKIKPEFRVKLQGVIQKHIDSAISSTVNLSEETTVEEVEQIYFQAWKAGCKGITVYREGSREGVLITDRTELKKDEVGLKKEWERPRSLSGQTIKLVLVQGPIYITVNKDENDRVREVFVNLGKSGSEEKTYSEAIGKLISNFLQLGGDITAVIHSLKGIQGRNATWDKGLHLLSVPDAIAKALEMMNSPAGGTAAPQSQQPAQPSSPAPNLADFVADTTELKHTLAGLERCPNCGEESLVNEGGCFTCKMCGFTKCE
jgi:ribonucleoside-diphosphate reductase alpha chain